jgi:serine/threonine-protein kinase
VTGGQTTKLEPIELSANLRDVGFSVRSVPAGASVWLDGVRTEQVTPAKLTGIKPGIHRLALKQDGYTDYELQMFVPEATVLQLPAAELVALPSAAPEPAHIGRRSRRAAVSDDDDSYNARRSRRSSDAADSDRSERKSYTSSYGSRSRQRAADADDEVLSGSRSSSAATSGKTGTLRLNSRPWSQVAVDGKPVGNTPQQNLQLSAGKHKIQLSNTQLGLTKTVSVTIKAGETLTQVVNLAER